MWICQICRPRKKGRKLLQKKAAQIKRRYEIRAKRGAISARYQSYNALIIKNGSGRKQTNKPCTCQES